MRYILIILATLFFPLDAAVARPLYGLDALAGAKYEKTLLKNLPEAVGVFSDTFGDAHPLIKKICKTGKVKAIRAQGVWSDTHSFGKSELQRAITNAKKLNALATAECKNVKLYYSPYCEHRLKQGEMIRVFNAIRPNAPNLILVNTPISGGEFVDGVVNEVHHRDSPGKPPKPYIFSFDGLHSVDADIEQFKKEHDGALIFFQWILQLNLKINHKDKRPRDKR